MSGRMLLAAVAVAALGTGLSADRQGPPAGAPQAPAAPAANPTRSGGIAVPTISLLPGLSPVPNYALVKPEIPPPTVPEGFTPIFNGKDLSGWHISKTARHGHTPDFHVQHGVIVGTQQPYGQGGLLLTDKKYRNFELTLEVKPDWGCDSGIFFRATEEGAAYQITMDYLGNGNGGLARLIGEGGISLGTARGGGANAAAAAGAAAVGAAGARGTAAPPAAGAAAGAGRGNQAAQPSAASLAWKREEWNLVRVRVEGDAPKLTVWFNGQLVNEQQDTANHAPNGMLEGPIVLQIHGGTDRWAPGGFWRWRNIGIKELPN